jgi:hypothetical protein
LATDDPKTNLVPLPDNDAVKADVGEEEKVGYGDGQGQG